MGNTECLQSDRHVSCSYMCAFLTKEILQMYIIIICSPYLKKNTVYGIVYNYPGEEQGLFSQVLQMVSSLVYHRWGGVRSKGASLTHLHSCITDE